MKVRNRRAYICCNESKKAAYRAKWEERMGEHITLVNHIEDASMVYIIDGGNVPAREKQNVIEVSEKLGITVKYLNQDFIDEEAVRNVLDGKCKPVKMEKSKSEDMEK